MNVEPMDEERFEGLTGAYGGESARWPQAERAPALRYLAATPAAHRTRADALQLDAMLDAWSMDAPGAALARRIAAGAPAARTLRARDLWISGVGLAAACVIGIMVGAGFGASSQSATHETDNATVNWNGTVVSGTTGGSPVPFY